MDISLLIADLNSAISENDVLAVLYSLNVFEVQAIHEGCIDQVAQEGISLRLRIAARMGWITSH